MERRSPGAGYGRSVRRYGEASVASSTLRFLKYRRRPAVRVVSGVRIANRIALMATTFTGPAIDTKAESWRMAWTETDYPTHSGQHWYNPPVIAGTSFCDTWKSIESGRQTQGTHCRRRRRTLPIFNSVMTGSLHSVLSSWVLDTVEQTMKQAQQPQTRHRHLSNGARGE